MSIYGCIHNLNVGAVSEGGMVTRVQTGTP